MNENNYECPKCHNVFPLANKMMHDFRCTESSPLPLNASRAIGININKKDNNNKEPIPHRPQPKITSKRRPDSHIKPLDIKESVLEVPETFNCWLCGQTLPEKEREDHMLCHQMEEENEKIRKKQREEQKRNPPPNQRPPQRPQQPQRPPNGPQQQQRPPHGPQQPQQPQRPPNGPQQQQRPPHGPQQPQRQLHGPQQPQRPPHGPQQPQRPPHGPQQQRAPQRNQQNNNGININLKRSFVPFESINIFDFNQVNQSLNKMDNPTEEEILNELPETEIGDVSKLDPERRNCIICLVDLKSGDKATMLPCIHMFHSYCVLEWLKTKNFCPVCKFKLTKDNLEI